MRVGLEKLAKGAEDVESMKVVLAEEEVKLQKANEDTTKMLGKLQKSVDGGEEGGGHRQ